MRIHASASLAILIWFSAATTATAADAEYAVRWDPADGGPGTLAQVAAVLKTVLGKEKRYDVLYFDIAQPGVPVGYAAIGRERGPEGGIPDATYKVRGPDPMPSELRDRDCPSEDPSNPKEVDVGVTGADAPRRSFSVSCTVKNAKLETLLPDGFKATPKRCSSSVTRATARSATLEVKIERWALPGGRIAIEVSMEGQDTGADFDRFRARIVKPLVDRKIVLLADSKTELGSQCHPT